MRSAHANTHAYTRIHIYIYTTSHIHTCMFTCSHSYLLNTHTHTHIYTHTAQAPPHTETVRTLPQAGGVVEQPRQGVHLSSLSSRSRTNARGACGMRAALRCLTRVRACIWRRVAYWRACGMFVHECMCGLSVSACAVCV